MSSNLTQLIGIKYAVQKTRSKASLRSFSFLNDACIVEGEVESRSETTYTQPH